MSVRVRLKKSRMKHPPPQPWGDENDYQAIFRKYISIGEYGEEHYHAIDMQFEAQKEVKRITDHQEIGMQYQKVVRTYINS